MFKKKIEKTMEVYVGDMLVESLKVEDHIKHLRQTNQILEKYQTRLNLTKCTFCVSISKFLRYMVTKLGIESNPEQIKALPICLCLKVKKMCKDQMEEQQHLTDSSFNHPVGITKFSMCPKAVKILFVLRNVRKFFKTLRDTQVPCHCWLSQSKEMSYSYS